ncbi:ANR family transcriptional regulator [Aeromonas veronii]|uniref:ANR family transcriptional regulator n=1 Tax=Aeromonas veronii TaxID=654 RepID=UPI001C5B0BA9|nr:ANR family transcriptional regulator [Aeromonas veronii]
MVSKEDYLKIANEAATLERTGNFKPAGEKWLEAQDRATTKVDVLWCETRASVCKHRAEKNR